ncbi:hypothetical protein D3C84_854560 [compost metagenome]
MLHQRLEEWRQQAIQVLARGSRHLACKERYGVFEQVEDTAQLVELGHGIGRCVFQGHLLTQGEDGQIRRAHPRQPDQLGHVL